MEMEQQEEAGGGNNRCRWFRGALETGLRSFIQGTFTACIVILVLSKHEKSHKVPLRAYVLGYLSGCVAYFALSLFRQYCIGGFQLVGRLGTAVRCFEILLVCFFFAWVVAGGVWVSRARSIRSDAPLLYWLSLVLVISSGVNGGLKLTIRCSNAEW